MDDRVSDLNVRDTSEIHWDLLTFSGWELWSGAMLQKHWKYLERSVDPRDSMSLASTLR